MKILVLSKDDYEFVNNDTGEIQKGSNVFYILEGANQPIQLKVNKYSDNLHLLEDIKTVPGIYLSEMETVVKKGNVSLNIKNVEFESEVVLFG